MRTAKRCDCMEMQGRRDSKMLRSGARGLKSSAVDYKQKADLIATLMSEASNNLPFRDFTKLEHLKNQAKQFIRRIFNPNSPFLKELEEINFTLGVYHSGTSIEQEKRAWEDGTTRLINLCRRMNAELHMDFVEDSDSSKGVPKAAKNAGTSSIDRLEYLHTLGEKVKALEEFDHQGAISLRHKLEMVIRKVFEDNSPYLITLANMSFKPAPDAPFYDGMHQDKWSDGKSHLFALVETIIDDLNLGNEVANPQRKIKSLDILELEAPPSSKKVFIVHGHDNEMKETVARVLTKLGLEPVILHEQPDKNRTVIEKFIANSDVGFAVVLLSGDDIAYSKSGKPEQARPRARQNVIAELGFFVGKLGREKVLPLYRKADNFEHPSDFAGVLYKEFDEPGHWRFELVKELQAAGYDVDANKLI